jgi:hypothetical protein
MPTVTETIRKYVSDNGAYKTAKETGLQYRSVREFLNGDRTVSGPAIDTLAKRFGLELKPKATPKAKPKGQTAGPKPRK